jgi:hypothetical protein
MAVAASALVVAAVVQYNSAVVVAAAAPAPAISCRQGEFNNQQRREAATEGLGWAQMGGQWWWYGTGDMKQSGWDGATIERTFSSGIKDSAAADGNRGATAPPTPSSDARAFERHRHAIVRAFVLGWGRRDDGADCIVVGNSGARGNVHCGRCGADKAEGDADDTIC